jgi:aspartyl-tRNA(Asn)/glutamyl-tRNA(Gln) amidotransferase subunit A
MTNRSDFTVADLAEGLENKRFSALELVTDLLNAAKENEELGCFLHLDGDSIKASAREADSQRAQQKSAPLLGVPIAIKDNILTHGIRTTAGSKILQDFIPPYNATVVTKLQASGALLFGKTNLDEFAMGSSNENSAFGPVRNPWNTKCVPGGSSGGSASAVAARIVPAALGTDTGGSIRQPASYCSLVGLKPTYGRVSRYGIVAFASSLDQVGPLTRTVEDCAILTEVISGHDPYDSTSIQKPVPSLRNSLHHPIQGLRIGIPKEYFIDGVNPEVKAITNQAIKLLEKLGGIPVEVSLPHTEAAVSTYYIIAPAEASSNLARYDGVRYGLRAEKPESLRDMYARTRSDGFGREVKRRIVIGTYVLSAGYYDAYYLQAQKIRTLIARDFEKAFDSQCDVIVCPTAPTTAFPLESKTSDPLEMYLNDIFTIPVNLAGVPALSVPCGFDSKGLPVGLQIIGKHWDEETILRVGHQYQLETEWHKKKPAGVR